KRSLIVRFTVSGQVPCSGAERRSKVLDEVSTAILGGAAAENIKISGAFFCVRCIFWLCALVEYLEKRIKKLRFKRQTLSFVPWELQIVLFF
ncbi:MAG: hypothetical protein J7M01_01995, partial [Candidatus Marinimicrobia bacterium]|nr:hypothetical protein [Candidatus Neomarinimicrobiota bacterium]